jgi:hypothetical protein
MSRSRIPKALRAKVAAQARYRCGYCLAAESIVGMSMELDHLIPEALGGLTEEDNLWLACSLCNDSKGCRIAAEDPTTGVVVRLFNPRHQDWHEHFSWSEGGSMITGGTPVGRATWSRCISTAPPWYWPGEPGSPWAGIHPRTDSHRPPPRHL